MSEAVKVSLIGAILFCLLTALSVGLNSCSAIRMEVSKEEAFKLAQAVVRAATQAALAEAVKERRNSEPKKTFLSGGETVAMLSSLVGVLAGVLAATILGARRFRCVHYPKWEPPLPSL